MSDQRPDDETLGRALGRAVESQAVRETPFSASRLASRLDRPARGGWLGALALAAALGLFVAMGTFFATRGPQNVAAPDASATPTVSPTGGPSVQPTAVPASCAPELTRVFFARDQLPPLAAMVRGTCSGPQGVTAEIGSRLSALLGARLEDVPSGAFNATGRAPTGGGQSRISTSMTVNGDLATVEIGVDPPWAARGAALSQALVQQLIYTITEVPGIRRAWLKDLGKQTFTIDQLVVDKPLAREDVHGYVAQSLTERISTVSNSIATQATVTHSVDSVAPGLARVVIALTPVSGQFGPLGYSPRLSAEVRSNDEAARPAHGKYSLVLQIDGIEGTASTTTVDGTPLRAIHFTPGTNAQRTATYELALDDLRPWRITLLRGPAPSSRVVVDIGGHPGTTAMNTIVYSPQPGATAARDFTVRGLARAFEATVSWRLRDSTGREVAKGFTTASEGSSSVWGTFEFGVQVPPSVTGNVTLEVYQASPRDGSDTDKVSMPLQVR